MYADGAYTAWGIAGYLTGQLVLPPTIPQAVTELKLFVLHRAEFHDMIEKHFPVIGEELASAAMDRVRVFQNEQVKQHISTTMDHAWEASELSSESHVSLPS